MTTRTLRMAAPLALSLLVSCGGGGEGAHSPLVLVEDAWVRPADAGMNSAIYLTLLNDQILDAFPAGAVPPVEEVTLRTEAEMEPYLREPLSEGWKTVYALPRIGQGSDL